MRHTISSLHYLLNRLPHVSPNNVGHLELKKLSTHGEAGCTLYCSKYNTGYMSHVSYIDHVQIKSLLIVQKLFWEDLQATSSTHLTRDEDKWSSIKDKRMVKLDFYFYFSFFPFKTTFLRYIFYKNQHIHLLVHGHSSWSTFGLHLARAQIKAL
jgi:hypothetical protein